MNIIKSHDLRKCCVKVKTKRPCYVCGKHLLITQRHHVYALSDLSVHVTARQLTEFIEPPTIPLCPTCHAYTHIVMKNPEKLSNGFPDLSCNELEKLSELLDMNFEFLNSLDKWLNERR